MKKPRPDASHRDLQVEVKPVDEHRAGTNSRTGDAPGRLFRRRLRGYDRAAVDVVIASYERELAELRETLEDRVTKLRDVRTADAKHCAELEQLRAREQAIIQRVERAERHADLIVEQAEHHAELLVKRADEQAEIVVRRRRDELTRLQQRVDALDDLRASIGNALNGAAFGLERATLQIRESLATSEQQQASAHQRQLGQAIRTIDGALGDLANLPSAAKTAGTPTPASGARRTNDGHTVITAEVFPIDSQATLRAFLAPVESNEVVDSLEVKRFVDETAELEIHTSTSEDLPEVLAHRRGSIVHEDAQEPHHLLVNLEATSLLDAVKSRAHTPLSANTNAAEHAISIK